MCRNNCCSRTWWEGPKQLIEWDLLHLGAPYQSYYPLLVRCLVAAPHPPVWVTFLEHLRKSLNTFFIQSVCSVSFLTYIPNCFLFNHCIHVLSVYFCMMFQNPPWSDALGLGFTYQRLHPWEWLGPFTSSVSSNSHGSLRSPGFFFVIKSFFFFF